MPHGLPQFRWHYGFDLSWRSFLESLYDAFRALSGAHASEGCVAMATCISASSSIFFQYNGNVHVSASQLFSV